MASQCPECGSFTLGRYGYAVRNRKKVRRYICKRCLRTTVNPLYSRGKCQPAPAVDKEGEADA